MTPTLYLKLNPSNLLRTYVCNIYIRSCLMYVVVGVWMVCTWFLKIVSVQMSVFVCVCVCPYPQSY